MEQELPTLPEHLSSSPVFSGVCVAQSLVFYVMFPIEKGPQKNKKTQHTTIYKTLHRKLKIEQHKPH
jgi:hypothetical protein